MFVEITNESGYSRMINTDGIQTIEEIDMREIRIFFNNNDYISLPIRYAELKNILNMNGLTGENRLKITTYNRQDDL